MPLPIPLLHCQAAKLQRQKLDVTVRPAPSLPSAATQCCRFGVSPHHLLRFTWPPSGLAILPLLRSHTILSACLTSSDFTCPLSTSRATFLISRRAHASLLLKILQRVPLASGQTPIWEHLRFKVLGDLALPAYASCYPYSAFEFFKCAGPQIPV